MKRIRKTTLMTLVFLVVLCLQPQNTFAKSRETILREDYADLLTGDLIQWGDYCINPEDLQFSLVDLDNDQLPEMYLHTDSGHQYMASMAFVCEKSIKELMGSTFYSERHTLKEYYPTKKIFVTEGPVRLYGVDSGIEEFHYSCFYRKFNPDNYFYYDTLLSVFQKEPGQPLKYYKYSNKKIEISYEEFEAEKLKLIGNVAKKEPVLYDNTPENREKYILSGYNKADIKLNKNKVNLYLDKAKTYQLKATIDGPSKKAVWTSSNKKVVTVSSKGKLIARRAGTATITVSANGKSATCKVTVKAKKPMNKYLKQIQGNWYTWGGMPYHAKYVFKGTSVKTYFPGAKKPFSTGKIVKIYKTNYGCYFKIKRTSYHIGNDYYGFRMNSDDNKNLLLIGEGDPYSNKGFHGTDSLGRTHK